MRLLEVEPHLPDGKGSFWTHNTGAEHSTKFSGSEGPYNALRRELQPKEGVLSDITSQEMDEMLFSDKHEVIYVYHRLDDRQGMEMVGGAIGRRKRVGDYASRMTVKELVVAPDVRQQHVASYMLGALTQNLPPTEMVVDTSKFSVEPWFEEKLQEVGFRHNTKNGSPALWLPGREAIAHGDFDNPKTVERVVEHIPETWNGYWEFYPTTDPQLQVFREGTLVGIARPVEGSRSYNYDIERAVSDFTLTDAGGAELGTIAKVTEKEAVIALLNNYELLDAA